MAYPVYGANKSFRNVGLKWQLLKSHKHEVVKSLRVKQGLLFMCIIY